MESEELDESQNHLEFLARYIDEGSPDSRGTSGK